jgi:DNA-binding transcriptional LysR family regulator
MKNPALKYLHSFLAIAQQGSYAKAAEHLALTQPSLSYQIKQLEEWVGVPLFERHGRRMLLSPSGERLRDWCAHSFAELDELRRALRQDLAEPEVLRVISHVSFGRHVLTPLLTRFAAQGVRIALQMGLSDAAFDAVERGTTDIGFVYTHRSSKLIEHHAVFQEDLVLVCHSQRLQQHAAPTSLQQCAALDWISYDESNAVFSQWFKAVFGKLPQTTASAHHVSEIEEAVAFVRAGLGWTIVPLHSVEHAVREGDLTVVRPRARRCENTVYAIRRVGAYASRAELAVLAGLAAMNGPNTVNVVNALGVSAGTAPAR